MKTLSYPQHFDELPILLRECRENQVKPHTHTFFELVYVFGGKAEHVFENQSSILQAGDFFLINLKCPHEYRRIGIDDSFRIVNCMFLPELIDESLRGAKCFQEIVDRGLMQNSHVHIRESATQKIFHDDTGLIGTLVETMLVEFEEKRAGYLEILRSLMMTVMLYLVRNENREELSPTARIIHDVKDYVEKHYSEQLSLSELCRQFNFSLSYISMLFRRECGMTFRDYVIRVRIEKSCRLLRASELTVLDIAQQIGYSDPTFFYKAFRREMAMTPDEYRRSYRRPCHSSIT